MKMVRATWMVALLAVAVTQLSTTSFAQVKVITPEQLRAAFLINFLKFTDWPQDTFVDAAAPYVIGIVGDAQFRGVLRASAARQVVRTRQIDVQSFESTDSLKGVHLLFISVSEQSRLPSIRRQLADMPTLTVSEGPRFLHQGGMVLLFYEDRRLRFEVNLDATRRARLLLSAPLLALAKTVHYSQ
jgi:hypothetical protein